MAELIRFETLDDKRRVVGAVLSFEGWYEDNKRKIAQWHCDGVAIDGKEPKPTDRAAVIEWLRAHRSNEISYAFKRAGK